MAKSRKLLIHRVFKTQYELFRQKNPKPASKKIFTTACQKALVNPGSASAISGIGPLELRGKLFKADVGGPGGFRLVYIFHSGQDVILPVLLTDEAKPRMRWEELPWDTYAEAIFKDLVEGKADAFEDWTAAIPG